MTSFLVALACSVFCFAKTITILGKILKYKAWYGNVEDYISNLENILSANPYIIMLKQL